MQAAVLQCPPFICVRGADLEGGGLGQPLNGVLVVAGPLEAAASIGVADGQVVRAAVLLVVAAHRVLQGAARPGEAVAKELAHAAAGAACNPRQPSSVRTSDL